MMDAFTMHVVKGYAQLQLSRGLVPAVYCQPVGQSKDLGGYSLILQLCKGVLEKSVNLEDCIVAFMRHERVRSRVVRRVL